jgi:hypothetical protein
VGAHGPQRLRDARHGAAADRLVAVEDPEPAAALPGQPAGDQADQRPGVPDVDRPGRLLGAAQPGPAQQEPVVALLDEHTER